MRTTLDHPVTETVPIDAPRRPRTWRDVLRLAAIGQVAFAALMFAIGVTLEGRADPMPVVIGAVVALGVVLLTERSGRGAVIYAGVVSLLLFVMVAMFGGLTVFTRAESTFELILFGGLLVVTVLGLISAIGALGNRTGGAAEVAPHVAGAFIALLVVVGTVAGVLADSATRLPGDLALKAEHFEFSEKELTADAGRIAVFVENEDVAHHDFTIAEVTVIDVPGQKAGRGVFDLEAGSYRFYCSLHPDMEGTLKVS